MIRTGSKEMKEIQQSLTIEAKRRRILTNDDARKMLRRACEAEGGQSEWALKHGVSKQYVGQILTGDDALGWKIARALGLKRTYFFVLDKSDEIV